MHFLRYHYYIIETCHLNKKRLLYLYICIYLLQVGINTKERINLQLTQINIFLAVIHCLVIIPTC